MNTRKYSHFIRVLKYLLPLFSVGLLAFLFVYPPSLSCPSFLSQGEGSSNTAKNLRYYDEDKKGNLFFLSSSRGQEISEKEVLLTKIEAKMRLESKDNVDLCADEGLYNKEVKSVFLTGNVRLIHSRGLELRTTEATLNFEEGTAENLAPIRGESSQAVIKAHGFKITDHGKKIVFLGNPELIIRSDASPG